MTPETRAAWLLCALAAAAASWSGAYGRGYAGAYPSYGLGLGLGYGRLYHRPAAAQPLLTVLAEPPAAVDDTLVAVPLLAVPGDRIRVLYDSAALAKQVEGASARKGEQQQQQQQMVPAVRVVLRRPLMVPAASSCSVPFPAAFTVRHGGRRVPLRVGALIAPVPAAAAAAPAASAALHFPVRVLYAVPVQPLALRPFVPYTPSRRPVLPPLTVTVLDFPEAVATPSSLFYQPPLEDGLGNREPPQPVIPAGVVQSTAPQPNLSVFVNSKESPILQVLRDEVALNEDQGRGEFVIDEDNDSIVVIAPN
ncbi:uncharacterized protein LOC126100475 isoform X2 [Schistocerca cancellata]|uniref:uncharacterized protein LOC126100475 isoform X2 n=1 Tax=Schistocerca cancellata TaxID=274614 RepID=UPI002117D524|nr:uncharacterized protein LOC126100475 isoform X2 [Schistocerca cancellata]